MHRLKQLVRRSLTKALYYSGALWLYAHLLARNRVVVLTYHRVLPSDRAAASFSSPAIVVTPDTFAMHMDTVKRWFTPLNASTFAAHSGGRACLVTFDDGWYDNHAFALPVLERTGVPMLLFVATNYIGSPTASGRRLSPLTCMPRAARAATARRGWCSMNWGRASSATSTARKPGARRWPPSRA